jgi:hypothetical protein
VNTVSNVKDKERIVNVVPIVISIGVFVYLVMNVKNINQNVNVAETVVNIIVFVQLLEKFVKSVNNIIVSVKNKRVPSQKIKFVRKKLVENVGRKNVVVKRKNYAKNAKSMNVPVINLFAPNAINRIALANRRKNKKIVVNVRNLNIIVTVLKSVQSVVKQIVLVKKAEKQKHLPITNLKMQTLS